MRRRLGWTLLISAIAGAALWLPVMADAGVPMRAPNVPVAMVDDAFEPRRVESVVGLGGVTWSNQGSVFHTATTGGVPWFDINLDAGESGGTSFSYAGTFRYYCRYHEGMTARLVLSPRIEPGGGEVGDTLLLTMGAEPPPAGAGFDVQRRRDRGEWVDLASTVLQTRGITFRRGGHFRFRVRMAEPGVGRSDWSPPVGVDIRP